jgi:hypothetical protein
MSLLHVVAFHCSIARKRAALSVTKRCFTVNGGEPEHESNTFIYNGPYAMLTTRLQAITLLSTTMGAVGLPILLNIYSGDISDLGQYAIAGTPMLAALGSTVTINFCFVPYVHTLEMVPVRKCHGKIESGEEIACRPAQHQLVKATWRNFLLMKQETVFDPAVDVSEYKGIRPFCNFLAKGVPLFVHGELLLNDELRKQLLGEEEAKVNQMAVKDPRKNDEDELF